MLVPAPRLRAGSVQIEALENPQHLGNDDPATGRRRRGDQAAAIGNLERRTRPDAERPYRAVGYPVLPTIYIVMALFIDVVLLRYKPQYTWPGLIVVLLGIPVYYAWRSRGRPPAPAQSVPQ